MFMASFNHAHVQEVTEIRSDLINHKCSACTHTPTYLVKTREWTHLIPKYTDLKHNQNFKKAMKSNTLIEYCLDEWEKIDDICINGWEVVHMDPPTYRIDASNDYWKYDAITCIKTVTCMSM